MSPALRREQILSLLAAMQREIRVEELASSLGVSQLTVRRDLAALEEERSVTRTHGGCIAAGRSARETAYQQRVARNFAWKQAIGRQAASLVRPGASILVNDGSTTFHLVSSLVSRLLTAPEERRPHRSPVVTIYTNSIAMLSEVSRCPAITLYLIGGRYDDEEYSLKGSFAETVLDSLRVEMVFLGADAVDPTGRCLVPTPEEARLTRAMLRSGRRAILLADHTKVGARSGVVYGKLSEMECWITTPGIGGALRKRYRRQTTVTEARL